MWATGASILTSWLQQFVSLCVFLFIFSRFLRLVVLRVACTLTVAVVCVECISAVSTVRSTLGRWKVLSFKALASSPWRNSSGVTRNTRGFDLDSCLRLDQGCTRFHRSAICPTASRCACWTTRPTLAPFTPPRQLENHRFSLLHLPSLRPAKLLQLLRLSRKVRRLGSDWTAPHLPNEFEWPAWTRSQQGCDCQLISALVAQCEVFDS